MRSKKTHVLKVWGDFGCFSRPEFKTERFSYPCPTPSAARGIFDSIYSKAYNRQTKIAEFYWQVTKIELLRHPSYLALRRNEISNTVAAMMTIEQWRRNPEQFLPLIADEQRLQRQTMALRKPEFRIHAHIVARPGFEQSLLAFDKQFERRATKGKFFTMPCLGYREFPAFYRYISELEKENSPADVNQDLGYMLYDVFDLRTVNNGFTKPFISIFKAEIKNGILEVPEYCDPRVKRPEVNHAS